MSAKGRTRDDGPDDFTLPDVGPERFAVVPRHETYRPTRWSTPWILLLPLFGWELWAVALNKPGGPLSHLVWWAYGDRWTLRWWVVSMFMNALGVWAAVHFMFEWPDWRHLLWCLAFGALLGAGAWGAIKLAS